MSSLGLVGASVSVGGGRVMISVGSMTVFFFPQPRRVRHRAAAQNRQMYFLDMGICLRGVVKSGEWRVRSGE